MLAHAVALVLLSQVVADAPAAAGRIFTNPILTRGADPGVIRHDDWYYLCQSRGGRITVRKTRRLEHLAEAPPVVVWQPPEGTAYSTGIWAPEMHRIDDRWYIYVAATDGPNANHRMYCLEGTEDDPTAPFILKGKVADPADRWAIDGTVYRHAADGRLYFIWSGWEGDVDVRQDLYIAPMSDPWTIAGTRVKISEPTHDWETIGDPDVNEGPQILRNGDRVFLVYSASGSWTDDYCLGLLELTGDDPLDPASWTKHPEPVFRRVGRVVNGPGHASFTKSPDGTEDWIIYHAARRPGSGWDRDVRMQPFAWNADGTPDFGRPVTPGAYLPVPSGGGSDREP